jgi:hypothetical protein
MLVDDPASKSLARLAREVRAAQDIYRQWAGSSWTGTYAPKVCLDDILSSWELLRWIDADRRSRGLATLFEELAACRRSLDDPATEKHRITERVSDCLVAIGRAVEGSATG